jgi:hypothetical protein
MAEDEAARASRRGVFKAGMAILAAGAAGAAFAKAEAAPLQPGRVAQTKVAQTAVQYQESPKDGNHCSICAQFVAPNACNLVAGTINPNGWCVLFAPKGS